MSSYKELSALFKSIVGWGQDKAPRCHSYTNPIVSMTRKRTVLQKPVLATTLRLAAQGKSKAISTSNTRNRMPTIKKWTS